MSAPRVILLIAAPALLCLTAGLQRYLAASYNLNPWRGGGFGMFADLHLQKMRVVTLTVVDANHQGRRTAMPKELSRQEYHLRLMPTQARITELNHALGQKEWVLMRINRGGKTADYPILKTELPRGEPSRPLQVQKIVVEVWQYDFDSKTQQMKRKQIY